MKKYRTIFTRWLAPFLVTMILGLTWATAAASPASASGTYRLVHVGSGLCAEVPNFSYNAGEQLRLNYCGGGGTLGNQIFDFVDAPWGSYIGPHYNTLCLTPGDWTLTNSTIIQWNCDFYDTRYMWVMGSPIGNQRTLKNVRSNLCLTTDTGPTVGSYLRQNLCVSSNTTRWILQNP